MSDTHTPLVYHSFQGGRFRDHGVPIEVLEDLVRYRDLIVEVAKALWRRNHPDRERLPKNFEEGLALKFYEVQPNCATIPLVRVAASDERPLIPGYEDELVQASDLVARVIQAADRDEALPAEFPKELLGGFDAYGRTLQADEWFELRPTGWSQPARYDSRGRGRLIAAVAAAYEDAVDVVAEVTMARVSKPRMSILLPDGREVEAPFAPDDEATIITALKDHQTARIRLIGRGQFLGDGRLARIIDVSRVELLPTGEIQLDPAARPIWEEIEEIMASVPADELDTLPRDGSVNLDHYLYGSPKK